MAQTCIESIADVPHRAWYPWFALKVRTRAEATVQCALAGKGYETYLPTYIDERRYSDRVKRVRTPLFPGYLFCRLDLSARLPVLATAGVTYVVGFGSQFQSIPDTEVDAIKSVTSSGLAVEPYPFLSAGQRVRIAIGCLAGLEGIFVRTLGSDRLVLTIEVLERSIAVELDRSWVIAPLAATSQASS